MEILPVGKGKKLKDGEKVAVLSIGPIGYIAKKAIEAAQNEGVNAAHYDMVYLKPIDEELLHEVGRNYNKVIVVENGTKTGGLGSAVMEFMIEHSYSPQIKRIGIPDEFIEHGSIPELYQRCGMDEESIKKAIVG